MTHKFSVGEALNETFQFALHRWPAVFRLGWAPFLVSMMIVLAASMMVFDVQALRDASDDPDTLLKLGDYLRFPVPIAILLGLLVTTLIAVVMSGFMASIYRLVALGEDQPGLVNIRFDGPAMRVFFAQIILNAIIFGILFGALLVGSMLTGISIGAAFGSISEFFQMVMEAAENGSQVNPDSLGDSVAPFGLFGVAFFLSIIPIIIVNIKLAPFMAGSAAENRLLLAGSLALTKGNFWPLLGYFFLLAVSLMVLGLIFQIVIGIIDVLASLSGGGALALIGIIANLIGIVLTIAYQLFTMAIQLGGQGIIYRRLKTGA